ncbi:MAG TPA: TolC family protein [Candidatus Binatia bacterium]|nr:TolC family protein [Candidatus Binatia bacterium]
MCVVLLAAIPLRAQQAQPFTVQTTLAMALTNNPDLKVFEAKIETARRNVGVAKTYSYNPELGYDEGLERHIGVSQTIEWPGKRSLREAIAKQDVAAAQMGLEGFKVALAAEVRAKFYDLLAARKTVELREREQQLARRVFDTASNRVARAYAPVTELTTAEAGMVLAKRSVRLAQSAATQAQTDLNALLGRDVQATIELEGNLAAPQVDVSLSKLTDVALQFHPDLRSARLELEKRGLNVRLAHKSGAPDITIQPFFEQDSQNTSDTKVGVGISVPLPIWNTSRPKVAAAQAELREAEADLETKARGVTANVARAFATWKTAKGDTAAFSPAFHKKMEAELNAAEQRYAEGQLPFLSLLELQRTYFDYMDQYYQSLTALHDAQAELEKAAAVSLEDLK